MSPRKKSPQKTFFERLKDVLVIVLGLSTVILGVMNLSFLARSRDLDQAKELVANMPVLSYSWESNFRWLSTAKQSDTSRLSALRSVLHLHNYDTDVFNLDISVSVSEDPSFINTGFDFSLDKQMNATVLYSDQRSILKKDDAISIEISELLKKKMTDIGRIFSPSAASFVPRDKALIKEGPKAYYPYPLYSMDFPDGKFQSLNKLYGYYLRAAVKYMKKGVYYTSILHIRLGYGLARISYPYGGSDELPIVTEDTLTKYGYVRIEGQNGTTYANVSEICPDVSGATFGKEYKSEGTAIYFGVNDKEGNRSLQQATTGSILEAIDRHRRMSIVLPPNAFREIPATYAFVRQETADCGHPIRLDLSHSTDQDGDKIYYLWELISSPAGSKVSGVDCPNYPIAYFTPDVAGEYRIRMRLSDAKGGESMCMVILTAR